MKANPTDKKLSPLDLTLLFARLFFLGLVIPLSIPILGLLIGTCLWYFVLTHIDGIYFVGGFFESFTFICAMAAFVGTCNLFIATLVQQAKNRGKASSGKLLESKDMQLKNWGDVYLALPGALKSGQNFALNLLALSFFTALQPARLHFESLPLLMLSAGVLTAGWLFSMTSLCLLIFVTLRRLGKNKNQSAGSAT